MKPWFGLDLLLITGSENLIQDYSINVSFFLQLQEFDLKKPLKIKYVGGGEQGLDMGGLQKEFFHMIVKDIFDPGRYVLQ